RIVHETDGLAGHRCIDHIARYELHRACPRGLALHAHANKVRVLAVILDPLGDLRLVGHLGVAAVDVDRAPAVAALAEALSEPARGSSEVAERELERALLRQRALRDLPD